ncbi:MAG: globin domain-containing protein [Thermonemataceae bacterium]|nr:globin domain-containing protein [Thermonemataceae bacterium]
MITPQQIEKIRQSWGKLIAFSSKLSAAHYQKLFEKYPDYQNLFHFTDMKKQKFQLSGAIALMVAKLEKLEDLEKDFKYFAKRHLDRGINPQDFLPFGQVLLESIGEVLGKEWTPEVRDSWQALYDTIAKAITKSMEEWKKAS